MSAGNEDSFIEDLHNALIWTMYYDAINEAVWALLIFGQFNSHLDKILNIYEKYLGE